MLIDCICDSDGTLGFLRKEQYAVALALMQDNEPVLGILGCPALPHNINDPCTHTFTRLSIWTPLMNLASLLASPVGCLLVAVRGQGCFMRSLDEGATESRVSVSDITDSAKANFTESVEASHSYHDVNQRIVDKLGILLAFAATIIMLTRPFLYHEGVTIKSIRMDSQCKYAILARGDASIYLRMTRYSISSATPSSSGLIMMQRFVCGEHLGPRRWCHSYQGSRRRGDRF